MGLVLGSYEWEEESTVGNLQRGSGSEGRMKGNIRRKRGATL